MATEPAVHCLILQLPEELGGEREVEVVDQVVAGRADNVDLVIQDVLVSRRHCVFRVVDGQLVVQDLSSQNGTWVNGELQVQAVLRPRDVVRIGNTRLQVEFARAGLDPLPTPTSTRFEKEVDPDSLDSFQSQALGALGSQEAVGRTLHGPDGTERLTRHTRNVTALYQAGQIVQRVQDPDEMLRSTLRLLAGVLDARVAAIALLEDDGELRVRAAVGAEGGIVRPADVPISFTVARRVVEQRLGLVTADVHGDQNLPQTESLLVLPEGSMMMVPVLVGNRALGLLQINSLRSGDEIHEDDVDLASTIAGYAGTALENRRMLRKQERTIAELRAARQDLLDTQARLVRSERAAAIGQLAGAMAHDGRNALQAVQALKLLKQRYPFDDELQMFIDLALDGQQMVVDMLEEVLAFVRGTEVSESVSRVNLASVARSMVSLARLDPDVRGRGDEVAHVLDLVVDRQPIVLADTRRLKQVVLNLVKNAAQAMVTRPGRIEVRVGSGPGGAFVAVRDNGAGMPPEVQARVFEPMFTTRAERGVGLGLHICKSIVERYGGVLAFETRVGEGTTFTLTLPEAVEGEAERG